jgi:hypothetical protein
MGGGDRRCLIYTVREGLSPPGGVNLSKPSHGLTSVGVKAEFRRRSSDLCEDLNLAGRAVRIRPLGPAQSVWMDEGWIPGCEADLSPRSFDRCHSRGLDRERSPSAENPNRPRRIEP